jgi:hypothetical protein
MSFGNRFSESIENLNHVLLSDYSESTSVVFEIASHNRLKCYKISINFYIKLVLHLTSPQPISRD